MVLLEPGTTVFHSSQQEDVILAVQIDQRQTETVSGCQECAQCDASFTLVTRLFVERVSLQPLPRALNFERKKVNTP